MSINLQTNSVSSKEELKMVRRSIQSLRVPQNRQQKPMFARRLVGVPLLLSATIDSKKICMSVALDEDCWLQNSGRRSKRREKEHCPTFESRQPMISVT